MIIITAGMPEAQDQALCLWVERVLKIEPRLVYRLAIYPATLEATVYRYATRRGEKYVSVIDGEIATMEPKTIMYPESKPPPDHIVPNMSGVS